MLSMRSAVQTRYQLILLIGLLKQHASIDGPTEGMQVQGMQSFHLHASLSLDNATRQHGAILEYPQQHIKI